LVIDFPAFNRSISYVESIPTIIKYNILIFIYVIIDLFLKNFGLVSGLGHPLSTYYNILNLN